MTRHAAQAVFVAIALAVSLVLGRAPAANGVEHGNVAFDIAPDGEHVVFVAADGNLYLLHMRSLQVQQLTKAKAKQFTPAFSPDGKSIAYAAAEADTKGKALFVRSLDGKQVRQLTDDANVSDFGPSYSPDGSKIVFGRAHRHRPYSMGGWTWDNYDVYTMNRDGSQLRRITQQNYYQISQPRFSRDGKSVIYSASVRRVMRGTITTGFQADAKGSQPPKPLAKDAPTDGKYAAWVSRPAVSPDGNSIAFFSDRADPFRYDLYVMNGDGTNPRPLGITKISHYNDKAVFTPDGKSVLFLAGTESGAGNRPIYSLWQVNTDGSKPRRIADSGLFTDPARWKAKQ
jgi:Tol biopolymer transport system component